MQQQRLRPHKRADIIPNSLKRPIKQRKSGRVVECDGLEIRFTVATVTRVRIPPFPPKINVLQSSIFLDLLHFQTLCALLCQIQ